MNHKWKGMKMKTENNNREHLKNAQKKRKVHKFIVSVIYLRLLKEDLTQTQLIADKTKIVIGIRNIFRSSIN